MTEGPKPPPRSHQGACCIDDQHCSLLLVIGGMGGAELHDVWILNMNTQTWKKVIKVLHEVVALVVLLSLISSPFHPSFYLSGYEIKAGAGRTMNEATFNDCLNCSQVVFCIQIW